MKPQFSWKSDSTALDILSGTARWDFLTPGNFVEMRFPTFNDAFLIDDLLRQTHSSGYSQGCKRVVSTVVDTLEQFN